MHPSIIFTLALSASTIVHEKVLKANVPFVERVSNDYLNQYLLIAQEDLDSETKLLNLMKSLKFDDDEVIRLIDSNTVKLKSKGLVSYAGVQIPSGYSNRDKFPDCMNKSPFTKAKQYLSSGSKVMVKIVDDTNGVKPRCLIVVKSSGKLVNAELVREGFATTSNRGLDSIEKVLPGFHETLKSLQETAETKGLGIYRRCENIDFPDVDQFEEINDEAQEKYKKGSPPPDPRPTSRAQKLPICADFQTYEDALSWFERYFPFYGDVAKLDKDGDGIPCSGLPHTTDQNKYRMKKPIINKNNQ